MASVANRIKFCREAHGLTAEELAKRIGINRASMYRYENGDIEKIPISIVAAVSKALDVDPLFLLGWEDKKTEPTDGELSEKDRTLINMMHSLDDSHQAELLKFVEAYISVQSQDKNQ